MPPRTALFEIATATRSNNYVCRSCLAALSIPHTQRRGYARQTKLTLPKLRQRSKTHPNSSTPPERAGPQRSGPRRTGLEVAAPHDAAPEDETSHDPAPRKGPRINYFEKDPVTGKITPIPLIEDDGEPEPTLRDIALLGRRTMAKFDVLDEIFKKLDKLDGPLEGLLVKHGPPGALEAYKAALKSYDEKVENDEEESVLPDLNAESDPTVKTEEVFAEIDEALSESKYGPKHEQFPELKDALGIMRDAWQTLRGVIYAPDTSQANNKVDGKVNDKATGETNDEATRAIARLPSDDLDEYGDGEDISNEAMFRALSRPGEIAVEEDGPNGSEEEKNLLNAAFQRGMLAEGVNPSPKASHPGRTQKDISAEQVKFSFKSGDMDQGDGIQSVEPSLTSDTLDEDRTKPVIWIEHKMISSQKIQSLWPLRRTLLLRLRGSKKAVGKQWVERKRHDDATQTAFRKFSTHFGEPYITTNAAFWQDVWAIFSSEGPWNPLRMARIKQVAEAMLLQGAPLTQEQEILAIEATFEAGATEKATFWWKRLVVSMANPKTRTELAFWELGVKMWCAFGDIRRAERACKIVLDHSDPSNPADMKVLLHLIQAYCTNPDTAEKGFVLYRRMRDLSKSLGKPMEIQDYDDVISLLLASGHTDYATYAFTDMMFAGTVDLSGKAKLPNKIGNTFFFGKWLKRLIGAGDLDGAYNVLIFMQKNGVMAATIHLNGLIGAWLRTGDGAHRTKAYKLAWAMIHSREAFVDLRRRDLLLEWPISLEDNRPSDRRHDRRHDSTKLDYNMLPRATTETFVIMASEYRERRLFGRLEELFVAYKKCEMPGDAMMMNELLAGLVAQSRGDKALEMYRYMVHEHGIVPSTDTFTILFASLPINMTLGPIQNNESLAVSSRREARSIFADMMRWAWIYADPVGRRGPGRALSEPQAKLILHTFRKANDLAGLSAAMVGLRDVLEYRLTRGVVLELIVGVVGMERPLPRNKLHIVRATMMLQNFVSTMQARGQLPTTTTPEGMKDWKVLYVILLQFYYQKMQAQEHDMNAPPAHALLKQAKKDMGVCFDGGRSADRTPGLKLTAASF